MAVVWGVVGGRKDDGTLVLAILASHRCRGIGPLVPGKGDNRRLPNTINMGSKNHSPE